MDFINSKYIKIYVNPTKYITCRFSKRLIWNMLYMLFIYLDILLCIVIDNPKQTRQTTIHGSCQTLNCYTRGYIALAAATGVILP